MSPGYFGSDSPCCQHELPPQLVNEFVATSQLQHVHQAGHPREYWQLWVHNTSPISDQVFNKEMLTVSKYKGTLLYFAFLPLQLIIAQWIFVEIQHVPPRCFKAQMFISGKAPSLLEIPQHFMISMREDRNVLPTSPAKEVAWFGVGVCWSCHKEPAEVTCTVHFLHFENFVRQILPAPFTCVCLITARI